MEDIVDEWEEEEDWEEDWSDGDDDDYDDDEEHEDHPQGPQLRQAAKEGQTEHVRELLDQGVDVDARDVYGWTALMEASRNGHAEVVKLLLSRQAQVDAQSIYGETAVIFATCGGHVEIVKLLEAAGADIHLQNNDGLNALMYAALSDRLPVCLFLLSKGADLMAVNKHNQTALTRYGQWMHHTRAAPLSPATLAKRRTALEEAWRAGPHPSQVQRRRDEAWDRRKSLMQVSAENGYRPLQRRAHAIALKALADLSSQVAAQQKQIAELTLLVAAQHQALLAAAAGAPVVMPPSQATVGQTATNPADLVEHVALDAAAKRHAHLLGQVLSNEGIHRNIVSML